MLVQADEFEKEYNFRFEAVDYELAYSTRWPMFFDQVEEGKQIQGHASPALNHRVETSYSKP